MQQNKTSIKQIPLSIWMVLLVMISVIVYLLILNNQLSDSKISKFNSSTPTNSNTPRKTSAKTAPDSKKPNIKQTMKDRKKITQQMPAEQTGLRMFDELKTVTGDNQELLNEITAKLVEEAAEQKQLEQQLADKQLTTKEFWKEVEELRIETEEYAESLLKPLQFDRYREVRQSWAKGRIHPDRDSRD
jgi:chromosome segregation ATPase